MRDNSHKRHIAKAITWRLIGTIDTIILSWIISGNPVFGLKIGALEVVSKTTLYYFHERIWYKTKVHNPNKRHIYKTLTWRIVGSLDTIIIGYFVTGNAIIGLKIGFFEVATKLILYYLHEKFWHKSDFGIEGRKL
ncbi:MAG: hypothetical protein DA407_14790 [Bacteroidetes bacterium]|nr:MAG: hypothetical protein DA407_14790 [Bacteroidota bacterium]